MGKNKGRDRDRHAKWEKRRNEEGDNGEQQEKSPLNVAFASALEFAVRDCGHDFARALGQKAATLRAWKSGRQNPGKEVKERVIAEAQTRGWKQPVQENA